MKDVSNNLLFERFDLLRELTLSENFGLGIPAAKDLNNGVTWLGELNSVFDDTEMTASVFVPSLQDGNISAEIRLDMLLWNLIKLETMIYNSQVKLLSAYISYMIIHYLAFWFHWKQSLSHIHEHHFPLQ